MRTNPKLQLSPGLVASYTTSSQETEWVYSGTQNTHTYLLTYLLSPAHTGSMLWKVVSKSVVGQCSKWPCSTSAAVGNIERSVFSLVCRPMMSR